MVENQKSSGQTQYIVIVTDGERFRSIWPGESFRYTKRCMQISNKCFIHSPAEKKAGTLRLSSSRIK
jgi:hypothetical protein